MMQNVQELFKDNLIKNELGIILFSYQCIVDIITQSGKSGANLRESLDLIQNVVNKLNKRGIC